VLLLLLLLLLLLPRVSWSRQSGRMLRVSKGRARSLLQLETLEEATMQPFSSCHFLLV
jgi:hypothetical protein